VLVGVIEPYCRLADQFAGVGDGIAANSVPITVNPPALNREAAPAAPLALQ
jgi:hypothetical protein